MKKITFTILVIHIFCVYGCSQILVTPKYSKEGSKMTSDIMFFDLDRREVLQNSPISVGVMDWWLHGGDIIRGVCQSGIYSVNRVDRDKVDTLIVSGNIISVTGTGDRIYLSKSNSENDIKNKNWIEVWDFEKKAILEKIELEQDHIIHDLKVSADNRFLAFFQTDLEMGESEFCVYDLSKDEIKVVSTFGEGFVNDIYGPSMIQWSNDTCYYSAINRVTEKQRYYAYYNGSTTAQFESNIGSLNSAFCFFDNKLFKFKQNNYDFNELVYFDINTQDSYQACLRLEEGESFGADDVFYFIEKSD